MSTESISKDHICDCCNEKSSFTLEYYEHIGKYICANCKSDLVYRNLKKYCNKKEIDTYNKVSDIKVQCRFKDTKKNGSITYSIDCVNNSDKEWVYSKETLKEEKKIEGKILKKITLSDFSEVVKKGGCDCCKERGVRLVLLKCSDKHVCSDCVGDLYSAYEKKYGVNEEHEKYKNRGSDATCYSWYERPALDKISESEFYEFVKERENIVEERKKSDRKSMGCGIAVLAVILLVILLIVMACSDISYQSKHKYDDVFKKDPNEWTESEKDYVDDFFEWQDKQND